MPKNKLKRYTGAEVAQPKSIAEQLLAGTKIGNLLYGKPKTYKDGNNQERKDTSFNESANGQLVQRMGETAKGAGNLVATGLAFGNPLTASSTMAPLIAGSQAYWIGYGINDGAQRIENIGEGVKNFVEDPSWQNAGAVAKEVPMLALDVAGALPVARTVIETGKNAIPAAQQAVQRITGSVDDAITNTTKQVVESGVVGVNELPAQLVTRVTSTPVVEPILNTGQIRRVNPIDPKTRALPTELRFDRIASGKPVFGMPNSRVNPDIDDAIAIRNFAKQYGYKVPKGIERYSGDMLDDYYKKILRQHNTFGRGVTPTETVNAETQLIYPYSQSMYHGETMPVAQNGVYTLASTSPYGSVSGVIQRHLDFTGPRSTWIQKNVVQPRYYNDVSDAISRKLISDPIYKDFMLKGDYDEMWKYVEKQYPKLSDSRGRIFTQSLRPNEGTFILGGVDNNSVGTVRNMFTPYSSAPKVSTRGFSKMRAKPYNSVDDDLRMLDDGKIIGFRKGAKFNFPKKFTIFAAK